ncbi:carboxypeptidase Q-like isoform X2 [Sycon ciliatum]
MLETMKEDGLDSVHGERAQVPLWVRGKESATLLEPRNQNLAMMGLGTSVGTSPEGITAEVLVVQSFDELHNRSKEALGKIIVYNEVYTSSGTSVMYRYHGAVQAAEVGGVAALIRSNTPFSIYSPHTGVQVYEDGVEKVPAACITVEDAEMLSRMAARGTKIVVNVKMEAKNHGLVWSRNTVAEIKGSTYPDQVVLVSGHLDSWDVGQGAMDDGGGAFISWQALSAIHHLGLRPKRTLRAVLWTGEEYGAYGSKKYYQDHKNEAHLMNIVMESDIGTFQPLGFRFTGSSEAKGIVSEIMRYMQPFNASRVLNDADGSDIEMWLADRVPGGSLLNQNDRYHDFHHSNGDTMTVQDPTEMDLCATLWAVVAYCLAEMDEMLPR